MLVKASALLQGSFAAGSVQQTCKRMLPAACASNVGVTRSQAERDQQAHHLFGV